MRFRSWKHPLILIAGASLLSALIPGQVVAALDRSYPNGAKDSYGYVLWDQRTSNCACDFHDISASGTALTFTPDSDDGGAVLTLADAFEFYGVPVSDIVVSTNGYLAFASTLTMEDGKDYSNDALLPVIPAYVPSGSPAPRIFSISGRVIPYHDDLIVKGGGGAQTQYFSSCPRTSEALGDEACTIIQWTNFGFNSAGNTDVFSFQAILYHQSFEIVLQNTAGDSSGGGTVTVGIQDFEARRGILYSANQAGGVPAHTGICLFEPRSPLGGPRADVVVDLSISNGTPSPGDEVIYWLRAKNNGPSPAKTVQVDVSLPSQVTVTNDACGLVGSNWAIGDLINGGSTDCTITTTVNTSIAGTYTGTASISSTPTDPETSNNTSDALIEVIPITHSLSIDRAGSGSGTVTSSPSGIDCGATCTFDFSDGADVTLTPEASTDSVFIGWAGACIGAGSCNVHMDAAKSVTATFNLRGVPSGFYPITPCRVFDTRVSDGVTAGSPILASGSTRLFAVVGKCGIPAEANAIAANITVINGSASGDLTIKAGNLTATVPPVIQVPISRSRANNAMIQLASNGDGNIAVINSTAGTVHLILDVSGYFR